MSSLSDYCSITHGKVAILEFDTGEPDSPISDRYVIAQDNDNKLFPTFVLKSEKNNSLDKAKQLQGLLWLTGYLARN